MPLVIPLTEQSDATDVNLLNLAELLGVECVRPPFRDALTRPAGAADAFAQNSCLAINAALLQRYLGESDFTEQLADQLCSRYGFIFVYNLQAGPYCEHVIRTLSGAGVQSIQNAAIGASYSVAADQKQICGPFAGLRLGQANPATDYVFAACSRLVSPLTSIDGRPQMVKMRRGNTQLFFRAATGVADIHSAATNKNPVGKWFPGLIQPAMLLRYMFPEEFWHQNERYASLVVDDPPLWPRYGYLNYESLLKQMDQHDFHTTIAFIPHNYRRSRPETVALFRQRPDRLSICFHGNDHTGAEFGEQSLPKLNQLLRSANARMERHEALTSLTCNRVMAFPQGVFSRQAMDALRSHNFLAAVNTEDHPAESAGQMELGDFIKPAILKYNFPLFLRKPVERITAEDVAFNLFFHKPVLIGAHHDSFEDPEILENAVETINSLCPRVHWSDLTTVVNNSYLTRKGASGVREIQMFSNSGSLGNHSERPVRLSIDLSDGSPFQEKRLFLNGQCDLHDIVAPEDQRISLLLGPGKRISFDACKEEPPAQPPSFRFATTVRSFCRRRLSEFRDNYLYKAPAMLTAARTLQRRVQGLLNLVL
jgi:hypothetical protein